MTSHLTTALYVDVEGETVTNAGLLEATQNERKETSLRERGIERRLTHMRCPLSIEKIDWVRISQLLLI